MTGKSCTFTTGTIGGWTFDSNAIYRGTEGSSGSFTSNAGDITLGAGFISAKEFYIDSNGVAVFKGTLNNETDGALNANSVTISNLNADNISTGTLTGRTVTVTHSNNVKTEMSPTRTAKTFDNGTTWYNYGNLLVYEFTSSGGIDLIAFKATFGYPGLWTVNNHYFKLDATAINSMMNTTYVETILARYTNIYPIASFYNNMSGSSGWKAWSPDDSYQNINMLVTDQAASGSNIKQVRFNGTGFSSGDYKIIFITDIYS